MQQRPWNIPQLARRHPPVLALGNDLDLYSLHERKNAYSRPCDLVQFKVQLESFFSQKNQQTGHKKDRENIFCIVHIEL